jgi:alkanesulfonate monooxygenase SsuD/methylene tetrahydromethanopterin reductase-like flavin-dependent oxidoreductase (luciferase family)
VRSPPAGGPAAYAGRLRRVFGLDLKERPDALDGHVGGQPLEAERQPSGLADKFAHFVRHGAIDGFNASPYIVPHGLDDIVDLLVPALQERGAYPAQYQGTTLREYLGLRPARSARPTAEPRRAG